jgi:hypothetical protein
MESKAHLFVKAHLKANPSVTKSWINGVLRRVGMQNVKCKMQNGACVLFSYKTLPSAA